MCCRKLDGNCRSRRWRCRNALRQLQAEIAALEKQLAERAAAGPLSGERLLESAEQVDGVTVVVAELPGVEGNLMRQLIDQVRGKSSSSAVLLASRQGDDKVTLVAGISKDLQARKLSAGDWIRPSRRQSAAAAAGVRTWPRRAARIPPSCPRLSKLPSKRSAK